MGNWMEKYERKKDEEREKELNLKLLFLLDTLDEVYTDKDRIKIIEKILNIYENLRIEACDYDKNDYISKKKELDEELEKEEEWDR